ncbi:MAG TPA: type II toxin-antitoxin system VapB family antitoxin [Candidatus Binatia bacterium]|nr:type II toxin-antitoxin system VapB family antitoxin [Candidatus Binatia bacterium]
MALSIKSLQTERLARTIAAKTGESITAAIQNSLAERLDRLNRNQRGPNLIGQLEEILQRVDQMPLLDSRTPEEIIGYDEDGFPH